MHTDELLYEPGKNFDIGDIVSVIFEPESKHESQLLEITHYRPWVPGNLNIRAVSKDGQPMQFTLDEVQNLRVEGYDWSELV